MCRIAKFDHDDVQTTLFRGHCPRHTSTLQAILPDQDGTLSDWTLPPLDNEQDHPTMLVVPVPNSDPGPPLQGVPRVEAAAEDPVGRGEE